MPDSITFDTSSLLYTADNAATTPSVLGKTRNWIEFIDGSWVADVGKKHYDARKSGTAFNFWEAYYESRVHQQIDHTGKETALEAAKAYFKKNPKATADEIKAAILQETRTACGKNQQILRANDNIIQAGLDRVTTNAATTATQKPGFWGKLFGGIKKIPGMKFIGKHFGPLAMLGATAHSIYQEVKNGGGLLGAGKELLKGLFGQGAYIGVTYLATAFLGIVNPVALLAIGIGGGILSSMLATKILGKSMTEKLQEAKEQQEELQKAQAAQAAQAGAQTQMTQMGPGDSSTRISNPIQTDAQVGASIRAAENIFNQSVEKFNRRYSVYDC